MHLWPSKKVRDFFTVSHLDFIERNRGEKLLQKQTSRTRSINGDNREVAGEGEAERAFATPRGHGFWKEALYSCCCLDFWFGFSDEERSCSCRWKFMDCNLSTYILNILREGDTPARTMLTGYILSIV